jgi:hypothetical protein
MADFYYWLGDASETTATIVVRSDTSGTVSVSGVSATSISLDPSTEFGIGKLTVTGLNADTRYPFTLYLDGVEQTSGTLRTMPVAGQAWNFGFGSCVGQHKLMAYGFQYVLDHDIRMFFALGDTPYCDEAVPAATVNGTSQCRWVWSAAVPSTYSQWGAGRVTWDSMYAYLQKTPGWAYLTERVPMYRLPDDHEYGDDWDWTHTNIKNNVPGVGFVLAGAPLLNQTNADQVGAYANASAWSWNKGNPDPDAGVLGWKPSSAGDTVAEHPPKFYRKTVGNVEFFHLDCYAHMDSWQKKETPRTVCVNHAQLAALGYIYSDPAGAALAKTMLGPKQLEWLLDKLASSTATFKIIVQGKVTRNMNANSTNHGWDQYQEEVNFILAFIKSNVTGVLWCAGDAHIPSVINDKVRDHCCVNSSPLGQINYISSSGTYFYRPGYSDGCIYRGEGMNSLDVSPGQKKNAYGVVLVTDDYLKPTLYEDCGRVLWEGYLMAGKNTLQISLDESPGEWA